ncbi:MAG: hypothetical protein GY888_13310 [Planctomycetaceae bacterium]|nr:hypothetical protein [Planctomycetaceae bacterium]
MKRTLLRILVAMLAALGGACTIVAIQFFGYQQLLRSPLPLAGTSFSLLLALVGAGMSIAPGAAWQGWENRLARFWQSLRNTKLPEPHRQAWIVILLSWCCFILSVTQLWQVHTDPTSNDPAAFLRYANEVRESGGIVTLVSQLFQGTYTQANQHPLFTALLSLGPTFKQGQLLSLAIGTLTLVVTTLLVARTWNLTVAAIFSVLLATNYAFCSTSALVTCEGLLTLFVSLTWLVLAQRDSTTTWSLPASPRNALAIGALLALAFLTKGTGPLFLVITLAWLTGCHLYHRSVTDEQKRLLPWRPLLLIITAWIVVASPLLTRNVRMFGNPIYNANSYFLFMDEFEDLREVADRMSVREAAEDYLASHSVADMLQRETQGLSWQSFIFIRSLGPIPLDDSRILFSLPLLLLALIGMLSEQRAATILLLAWIVGFLIMFAWYLPIAAGQRFMVPLLPALLMCTAVGLARIAPTNRRLRKLNSTGWLSIGICWCLAWTAITCLMLP